MYFKNILQQQNDIYDRQILYMGSESCLHLDKTEIASELKCDLIKNFKLVSCCLGVEIAFYWRSHKCSC